MALNTHGKFLIILAVFMVLAANSFCSGWLHLGMVDQSYVNISSVAIGLVPLGTET